MWQERDRSSTATTPVAPAVEHRVGIVAVPCPPGAPRQHVPDPSTDTHLGTCLRAVGGARAVPDRDVRSRLVGGRYQLDELIGRGGTAEVYLARDALSARTVAVKLPRPDRTSNPGLVGRCRREAQSAARLDHPNIVPVLGTGQDEVSDSRGNVVHRPYIVLEWVSGSTLREVLADRQVLRPDEAMRTTAEVLAALQHSHERGVVHGDVTAANVMVSAGGVVKVLDFDNSHVLTDADVTHTLSTRGTPAYSAPEQVQGMAVDARTDVYSTGCLLYELLTGSPPFSGESAAALARQHVHATPHPPSLFCSGVAREMDALVLRALAKEPEARHQTAEQFRHDLLAVGPRHDRRKVEPRDG
ncbi:protein kinase [Geodermatophilus sp. TF02-6]|uniref:protein kinase domain-containing protein n=1 Tax=Geodermatophilus sp. TF02-6 TaxID=2250575 RepID=UPI00267EE015